MAIRTPLLNYYDILGLPRDASLREIEAAYRTRVVESRDQPGGAEETRRINLAYRALSDPDRRRDYDAALGGTAASAVAGAGAAGALFGRPAEADAQANHPWPTEHDVPPEQWDDDETAARPRNSRRLALLALLAGFALLAVLFASSWLGRDEPQVAASEPAVPGRANAPGATAARPAQSDDRGWLEETIDQVASLGQESPEAATAQAGGVPAAASPSAAAATEQADAGEVAPKQGEQASAEPPSEAAPTQTAEAAPRPEPEPQTVAAATPPPPPAPTPDRSAPARLISGGLYDSDNRRGRFTGSVGIRLQIGANGRVQGCQVSRSSGNGELDSTTCRLLSERLQFTPALNRNGEPVPTTVQSSHVWGRRRR